MWFFNSFVKSLYDLNWLRGRRGELGKAFSYFFLFIFFVSGLYFAPLAVNMMRGDGVAEMKKALNEKVPDFTATVAGGELSVTGLEQPLVFRDKDENFVFVVDTMSTATMRLEDYLQDGVVSGAIVTRYGFEMYDNAQGRSRAQSFKNFGDFSFNRDNLINIANKFLSKPALVIYALILFAFMYAMFAAGKLFFVLVVAALIALAAKIGKKKWVFKELYAVGLFACTLPSVLNMLMRAFDVFVPYVTSAVFLLWLGAVVFMEKNSETPAPGEVKQQ